MAAPAADRARRIECGASAIEFAFVFPVFVGLIYAIVCYGLLFGLQHSLTAAAKEAARATVACDPSHVTVSEHESCAAGRARATAAAALAWLPADLQGRILGASNSGVQVAFQTDPVAGKTVAVLIQLPNYAANPILPTVTLPFVGTMPPLPARLAARAVVAL